MKNTSSALVTEHIRKLPASLAETVEAIRQTILAVDPQIGEQIKWNSPAFYYTGEMKPFDPKEYKRDIVVLNLHRGHALLVFPTGARIADTTGLLEGKYADGRRLVTIRGWEDLKAKEADLQEVIRLWLAGVE